MLRPRLIYGASEPVRSPLAELETPPRPERWIDPDAAGHVIPHAADTVFTLNRPEVNEAGELVSAAAAEWDGVYR